LVSLHESMHGRIFRETPDGQLHAGYCLAVEQRLLSGPALEAVTKSSQTFFEASRLAHESFATYLSVKALPAAEESTYREQLTPEYMEYFNRLADNIDAFFPTSHLQFLLAWNFAVVVFSSPLIERFHTLDVSLPIELSPDENPGYRFESLLKQFGQSNRYHLKQQLEKLARETCAQRGLHYWDIFSEDAWMEAVLCGGSISAAPAFLEMRLSELLQERLLSIVPFTVLRGSRLAAAFATYANSSRMKLNFQRRVLANLGSDQERLHNEVLRAAAYESQSRIANSECYSPQLLDDLPGRTEDLLRRFPCISIYSDCPPGRNLTHWSILGWVRQAKSSGGQFGFVPEFLAQFRSSDVLVFLQEWMDRKARGVAVPELGAIIIAVRGPTEYAPLLENLGPILDENEDLRSKLCWYCWEGFMEMHYELAGAQAPLLFGNLHEEAYREVADRHPRDTLTYNGLVVKTLQVGEKARQGVFMRALPMQSAASLSTFQDLWFQAGKLEPASVEVHEKLVPLTREVIEVARTFWREY
jgi:hypothetical protein